MRKYFGTDRSAAVTYVEKAPTLKRSGEGIVPATAKRAPQTFGELAIVGKATMVNELCDDALDFSKRDHRYKPNPPIRIAAIRARFGDQQADSVRPAEITSWLESLGVKPGTEARYKSTLSLCYREGMKNQKSYVQSGASRVEPQGIRWGSSLPVSG